MAENIENIENNGKEDTPENPVEGMPAAGPVAGGGPVSHIAVPIQLADQIMAFFQNTEFLTWQQSNPFIAGMAQCQKLSLEPLAGSNVLPINPQ